MHKPGSELGCLYEEIFKSLNTIFVTVPFKEPYKGSQKMSFLSQFF
jgi:hypothetical protein